MNFSGLSSLFFDLRVTNLDKTEETTCANFRRRNAITDQAAFAESARQPASTSINWDEPLYWGETSMGALLY